MKMPIKNRPLYLVTDRTGLTTPEFLDRIQAACAAGVDIVQLREKDLLGREYFELAQQVKRITDQFQIPLIIDDRIDVAQAVDAAGVHIGQADLSVAVARQLMGAEKLVGATTKTVTQALEAAKAGADYVGVGAIFETTTHVKTVRTSVATLAAIKDQLNIPVYALGGLTADNVAAVTPAHVDGVAVVSAIMKATDVTTATRVLRQAVLQAVAHQ
ncbi:thiamine-phosphate diphosphorylase [Secundilactobacillus kimchicus JCM 15530]|uniref:Thiamine-phosphate synthase n=2 Tax=Secundilactobacillus kimchicus TaxID=528209 RepID=A0A0R1HPG9_9LACO|nr:thiamine-phosphate diphosphorylase [Secundilactobacillus kimchicus JCM 15530]